MFKRPRRFYCSLHLFIILQGVSVYISTASLTTIALERLKAVKETNMMRQTDRWNAVSKIALINVLSVVAILPYCLHMEVKEK